MREASIEQAVVRYARTRDCIGIKMTGAVGIPDRLFIAPSGGRTMWVEFKREGEKPRPIQVEWIQRLRARGCDVVVVDSIALGKEMIDLFLGG